MADTATDTTTSTTPPRQRPPAPDASTATDDTTDWKAEAEKFKTLSRKHEERAKANAAAAKELEQLRQQSMTEQEKAVEQAKAEGRAEAIKARPPRSCRRDPRCRRRPAEQGTARHAPRRRQPRKFVDDDGDVDATRSPVRGRHRTRPETPDRHGRISARAHEGGSGGSADPLLAHVKKLTGSAEPSHALPKEHTTMAITAATVKTSDFSGFLPRRCLAPSSRRPHACPSCSARPAGPARPQRQERPGRQRPARRELGRPGRQQKPATQGSMTLKTMTPKKLAAIAVDSMEVIRARTRAATSTGSATSSSPRRSPSRSTTRRCTTSAATAPAPARSRRTSTRPRSRTSSAPTARPTAASGRTSSTRWPRSSDRRTPPAAAGASPGSRSTTRWRPVSSVQVDSTGRPIWVDLAAGPDDVDRVRAGSLIGRRSFMGEGVADPNDHILGYAGDWTQAAWGVVGGIDYSISDQATVTINGTLTSLWEHNLVAIRAEAVLRLPRERRRLVHPAPQRHRQLIRPP
jgi:hypothetical protein